MVKRIVVTRSFIVLEKDGDRFYIGAKHFDFLIKAIENARTLPEGTTISLKIPKEYKEEKEEIEEKLEGEEEELGEGEVEGEEEEYALI
jgi:hypothetical protein